MLARRIPRQGVRVSRISVEVDATLRARYFPIPDQSCVVGKKLAFTCDHLLHKHGRPGCVGRKPSSLVDIPMVVEHIREDDRIPGGVGHFQCFTDLAFRCLAPESM
jgi:hypothetical protein